MAHDGLPDKSEELTGRESEVVRLSCEGKTDVEIAETLQVSINTVYNHKTTVNRKFDVRNVRELFEVSRNFGIIENDELHSSGGDGPEKKTMLRRDA
jgi:DNA-binding CsgD family transcriptional regulator